MSGCTPTQSIAPGEERQVSTLAVAPLSRTAGEFKVEVAIENGLVVDAQLGSGKFQGLELLMAGRDPYTAPVVMQEQSGVCAVSQAVAAVTAQEQAARAAVPSCGRVLRNLMQAAAFIQSHIGHFYQQALPDYIQGADSAPFRPRYPQSDLRLAPNADATFTEQYFASLEARRFCNKMIALFGERSPRPSGIIPGGTSVAPTRENLLAYLELLRKLELFVRTKYLPQVYALAAAYKDDMFSFGQGYRAAICMGALPLTCNRVQQVFRRGIYSGGRELTLDARMIKTYLRYARFDTSSTGQGFRDGKTLPQADKKDGYSFIKAARYDGLPLETGALARMWLTNPEISASGHQLSRKHFGLSVRNFRDFGEAVAFSVMGRHIARAEECFYLLPFMERWLQEALPGDPVMVPYELPKISEGIGLTEAPQGALLHYVNIQEGKVARYQVISPEMWNASPRDDLGQRGVIEQALVGVPVPDEVNPVNIGRVVRSFGM